MTMYKKNICTIFQPLFTAQSDDCFVHKIRVIVLQFLSWISTTVESRFLEPSVSRTSRYLEPNLVSLGFASLELYNFTPDFSNPRFLETLDNSNQFWLPWDKLILNNSNLRKFPNHGYQLHSQL